MHPCNSPAFLRGATLHGGREGAPGRAELHLRCVSRGMWRPRGLWCVQGPLLWGLAAVAQHRAPGASPMCNGTGHFRGGGLGDAVRIWSSDLPAVVSTGAPALAHALAPPLCLHHAPAPLHPCTPAPRHRPCCPLKRCAVPGRGLNAAGAPEGRQ